MIVRTRFQPTVDLDVPDAEAAMLRAQGLLVEPEPDGAAEPTESAAAAPQPPAAAPQTPAAPTSAPEQQDPVPNDPKDK